MSESVTTYADLASSRFLVLNAPVEAPGVCAICGTSRSDDRDYVDFGLFVEYVGKIYFCSFCVTELTNRMGCLTPDQSKQLEDQLDAAKQEILSFQKEKAAVDDAIRTLRNTGLFDSLSDGFTDPTAFLNTKAESEDTGNSGKSKSKPTRSNSKAEQSDPKQGSDDLSTTASNELTEFDGF